MLAIDVSEPLWSVGRGINPRPTGQMAGSKSHLPGDESGFSGGELFERYRPDSRGADDSRRLCARSVRAPGAALADLSSIERGWLGDTRSGRIRERPAGIPTARSGLGNGVSVESWRSGSPVWKCLTARGRQAKGSINGLRRPCHSVCSWFRRRTGHQEVGQQVCTPGSPRRPAGEEGVSPARIGWEKKEAQKVRSLVIVRYQGEYLMVFPLTVNLDSFSFDAFSLKAYLFQYSH